VEQDVADGGLERLALGVRVRNGALHIFIPKRGQIRPVAVLDASSRRRQLRPRQLRPNGKCRRASLEAREPGLLGAEYVSEFSQGLRRRLCRRFYRGKDRCVGPSSVFPQATDLLERGYGSPPSLTES
jgi:hypothetical protein